MPKVIGRLLVLAAVVLTGLSRPAFAGDGTGVGSSTSQDPAAVTSWLVGAPNGGVPGGGGASCSWSADVPSNWVPGQSVVAGSIDARSVPTLVAWVQTCGSAVTLVWVPILNPQQLAPLAGQQLSRLLPLPVPVVGPPKEHAIVNYREWLAVTQPAPVSATVGTPAVTVTATATPVSMSWDMGDGHRVDCDGFGQVWAGQPVDFIPLCSYLYTWPSVDSPGDVYPASVKLVWKVSWRASTGEGGVLGDLTTTTAFGMHVGEVQTVYSYGPGAQPVSMSSGPAP
jgi:hypothetical protein